jgi:hypothetical protein
MYVVLDGIYKLQHNGTESVKVHDQILSRVNSLRRA